MDPKLMSLFLATAAVFVAPGVAQAGPEEDRRTVAALDVATPKGWRYAFAQASLSPPKP